jgi:hypothetical protein
LVSFLKRFLGLLHPAPAKNNAHANADEKRKAPWPFQKIPPEKKPKKAKGLLNSLKNPPKPPKNKNKWDF